MNKESIGNQVSRQLAQTTLPQSIMVSGRRYISVKVAGQMFGYCDRMILYLVKDHSLPHVRKSRIYVAQSELSVLIRLRKMQQTKWSQMAIWWKENPGKHRQIRSSSDLVRRLERDGITVSQQYATKFLASRQEVSR